MTVRFDRSMIAVCVRSHLWCLLRRDAGLSVAVWRMFCRIILGSRGWGDLEATPQRSWLAGKNNTARARYFDLCVHAKTLKRYETHTHTHNTRMDAQIHYTCTHTHTRAHARMHARCTHTHTHARTHARTHTHTNECTYIHWLIEFIQYKLYNTWQISQCRF